MYIFLSHMVLHSFFTYILQPIFSTRKHNYVFFLLIVFLLKIYLLYYFSSVLLAKLYYKILRNANVGSWLDHWFIGIILYYTFFSLLSHRWPSWSGEVSSLLLSWSMTEHLSFFGWSPAALKGLVTKWYHPSRQRRKTTDKSWDWKWELRIHLFAF